MPRSGLDFRPIALLDTDYKIYARVLLNRLSPHLATLVAPTQYGFVSGRQVHDALDVFHGLQALVRRGAVPKSALAVLLDFAKAYDTLDRDFLLRALQRLGLPPAFRQAVEQMHLHTSAEYAADDAISTAHPVLNGIRQGCPLAPTLFVLAVNTLYEAIDAAPDIKGVQLPGGSTVCAAGYADDTACYLTDALSVRPLHGLLERYGTASGLCVNVNKCLVVRLGHSELPIVDVMDGFPVAGADTAARLLGGQVATQDISADAWRLTMQQIRARMHWAALKTTNELQRVKLLRAILLPKFLFVARHLWPTAPVIEQFQQLIDDYVWGGGLGADGNRRRAWMSESAARAPIASGGLHIPQLTHELQIMSVATVQRWGQPVTGAPTAVCNELLRTRDDADGSLAASRRSPPSTTSMQRSLAATGWQLQRALSATPRTADELALLLPLLDQVGRGTSVDYHWEREWLCCQYSRVAAQMSALRQLHASTLGNLHHAALLQTRASSRHTIAYRTWSSEGDVRFRAVRLAAPLSPHLAVQFRRLCDTIVFNYPGLLRPPAQPEDLIFRPATMDVWRLRPVTGGYSLMWSPVESAQVDLGLVQSTAAASVLARGALGRTDGRFELHTWLDSTYAVWTGVQAPTPSKARGLVEHAGAARSAAELVDRTLRWEQADEDIKDALITVSWHRILRMPGVPSVHRLLFHKLKAQRANGWDRVHEHRGCPHCPALGAAGGDNFHIFWGCPQTQLRWQQLLDFWAPLHSQPQLLHSRDTKHSIFGLRLQAIPDRLWALPALTRLGTPTAHDTVATRLALDAVWCRQVLLTAYTIWRWRTTPDAAEDIWPPTQTRARHGAGLRGCSHDVRWERQRHSAATRFTAAALDSLFDAAPTEPLAPPELRDDTRYLLFFDGGSRGNPGPGGSGAVVVRVDASATQAAIVWSAAMAHGDTATTNNIAEYQGLLTGLQAARSHLWFPLEVVGDSQLILDQMSQYHPPKNQRLVELYARARRLADELQVRTWTHHRRAHNRMADEAANVAMNTRTSSQVFHPTTRDAHAHLATLLHGDFAHWQIRRLDT